MRYAELSFAKIVSNPSSFGWCQVYSAGKLFAAISLEKQEEPVEKDYLNVLGKEILNTLEQEYFILETKDLNSIREAVLSTTKKLPEDVIISFVIGSVVGDILYVFIIGNGKVDMKRENKLGTILEATEQPNSSLKEASGFLQDKDVIILQTSSFSDAIPEAALSEFLENSTISEAAENIAPVVHEKENPLASVIITEFKKSIAKPFYESPKDEAPEPEENNESKIETNNESDIKTDNFTSENTALPFPDLGKPKTSLFSKIPLPKLSSLNHPRKVILTIVIIVVIIFAASIFFAMQKQQNDKLKIAFENTYPVALGKYEEGQSLADLNQSLAKDSFLSAKKTLEENKSQFINNSDYAKQIDELLEKINTAINSTAKITESKAVSANEKDSIYLSEISNSKAQDFISDDKFIYTIDDAEISSITKNSTTSKTLIENDKDWGEIGGFATYNTNLYVLDKDDNKILKFVNNGSSYTKSEYLASGEEPNFSNAISMTIDNNIYVLTNNGDVFKFFKGKSEDFSLKGLDNSLSKPTRIYSNPDIDNIYILDNGNSRIVALDKSGTFKAQYQADIIRSAKEFEILEEDKKIFILSGGKIYKIDL